MIEKRKQAVVAGVLPGKWPSLIASGWPSNMALNKGLYKVKPPAFSRCTNRL